MKITTKFRLTAAFSLCMVLVIGVMLFFTWLQVRTVLQEERIVHQIIRGICELHLVTDDYLLHYRERARIQWQLRYDSLTELIRSGKFRIPEEQYLLEEIRQNHAKIHGIFSQLTANYENQKSSGGRSTGSATLEKRLASQLAMRLQTMKSNAEQLAEKNHKDIMAAQQSASIIIMLLMIMIAAMIAVNSLLIGKSIVRPITKLQKDIQIVGKGNLDYKVATAAKDEIGEFSRAFDRMTQSLAAITVSRDKLTEEVNERKKTEEQLRKAKDELMETNAQLQQEIAERKQAEVRIKHLNAVLRAIRNVNQLIVREKDRDRLLQSACDNLVKTRGFSTVWIALLDGAGQVVKAAESGLGEKFLPFATLLESGSRPYCIRQGLAQSDIVIIENLTAACGNCPLASVFANDRKMTVRLEHEGQFFGVLTVSLSRSFGIDTEEQRLLEEVAGDIAFALYNIELEEKRKRAEAELEKYREHLEELVAERTTELQQEIRERKQVEEALRDSEELYRVTFNNITDAVFLTDNNGAFTFICPNVDNIFRYSLNEVQAFGNISRLLGDALFEPDELVAAGELKNIEKDIADKFGQGHTLLVNVKRVSIKDATRLYTCHDITERKRAEEALRENETRFRTISELVSDYVYVLRVEPEEHLVREWVTDACTRITGYTPEEIDELGGWIKVVHPDDRDIAFRHRQEFLSGQEHISEYRIISKRREIYWLRDYSRPVRETPQRRVVRVFGAVQDITARKRAEEEVLLLKNAIETAHVGVTITDTDRKILYVNPAEAAMHGYTAAELIGKDARIFSPEEYWQEIEFTQLENDWERETVNIRKDGTTFPIHSTSTPVRNEDGTPAGIITISEDITDRKQAEEELQHAKQAADAANRAKSEFLANMSHELRTPLNAIIGFSQLLSRRPGLDAEQHEYLSTINRSSEHLLTLINQVLDLSKIEAGRMTLNEQNFDLYRLLDDVENMFRLRAEEKHLQLLCNRASDVPQYVRTDEVKLRQVLINLLNNAIKFTEEGSVTLRIANSELRIEPTPHPSQEGKSEIRNLKFEIEDTGLGIAPGELEHLFDAFTQATTGRETVEGTGLGLAISQKFVQLLGGQISVNSKIGKGSVFTVDVPVHLVDTADIEIKPVVRHVIALAPNQPRYRILIVDDNRDSRQFLVNLLSPLGFELGQAENGQEAFEVWEHWKPHLIWMDLRMPVMDGYEATKRIRNEELKMRNSQSSIFNLQSSIPIIALTASPFEEVRAAALAAGCDDLLGKPFHEADVFDLMHKHLSVRYVYEEEKNSKLETRNSKLEEVLTPIALAALPSDLVANLEHATLRSDAELIDQVIHEIRTHDTGLAEALAHLANTFAYDTILKLIQEAKI